MNDHPREVVMELLAHPWVRWLLASAVTVGLILWREARR
jgi:hypothetical protein